MTLERPKFEMTLTLGHLLNLLALAGIAAGAGLGWGTFKADQSATVERVTRLEIEIKDIEAQSNRRLRDVEIRLRGVENTGGQLEAQIALILTTVQNIERRFLESN